jgi:hypothetical protein
VEVNAYPSVLASPSLSRNQKRSLHDQDTHTFVPKCNGGVTRRNMKNVLSHIFSPLLSLHPYSFSHSIISIFPIVSLLSYSPYHFPHLTFFLYSFPRSHSFPFSFISHIFLFIFHIFHISRDPLYTFQT